MLYIKECTDNVQSIHVVEVVVVVVVVVVVETQ